MRSQWFDRRAALVLLLALLLPVASTATPVVYTFTSGSVDITGTVGTTTLFSATGIPLTGAFVTFDAANPTLDDFDISGGPSGLITLSSSYGGFDGFTLDSFTLSPGTGYTNISVTGGPTMFSFVVGPADATGVATAYIGTTPIMTIPFMETSSAILGTIDIGSGTLTLSGVTLLVISGISGELVPLIVKGDITFTGMVVPEPAMMTLLALGAGLVWRQRNLAI